MSFYRTNVDRHRSTELAISLENVEHYEELGTRTVYPHSKLFQPEFPVPGRPCRNETAAQVNYTDLHQMEVLHL